MAHKMYDSENPQPRRIAGGLAAKLNHRRQLSQLAIIEEDDVPPSRDIDRRDRSSALKDMTPQSINPRSA